MRLLTTRVCVVGCGPAGAMLGLMLARAGVDVVVLEKHADFLRDFRGDTVHPSTLQVLDELGLAEKFLKLPHHKVPKMGFVRDGRRVDVADFTGLKFPYIALVPQWDFLDMITAEAAKSPHFRLIMRAAAYDVLSSQGRVTGVRYRDPDGEHELRADLTIATDGRHSAVRRAVGMSPKEYGVPMDIVQFRISRKDTDPADEYHLRMEGGRSIVVLNRGTYWNFSYMIRKGGFEQLKETGIEVLRDDVAHLIPFVADRAGELGSFDDTSFLEVRLNRLRRWYGPGFLVLGDAAHAMTPVAGVGINLAVQDAVAAANLLTPYLLRPGAAVPRKALAAVQRRRRFPAAVTQGFQWIAQKAAIDRALKGGAPDFTRFGGSPLVGRLMGRLIGAGVRPEHVTAVSGH